MSSPYYLGTTPTDSLGDSPRFWYGLRRNEDGELFLVRSDQLSDLEAYQLNIPGPPDQDFEDFEVGVDYFEGIDIEHELINDNMYYPQYKWDDRSLFYYVDSEGMFTIRINRSYSYPAGISS